MGHKLIDYESWLTINTLHKIVTSSFPCCGARVKIIWYLLIFVTVFFLVFVQVLLIPWLFCHGLTTRPTRRSEFQGMMLYQSIAGKGVQEDVELLLALGCVCWCAFVVVLALVKYATTTTKKCQLWRFAIPEWISDSGCLNTMLIELCLQKLHCKVCWACRSGYIFVRGTHRVLSNSSLGVLSCISLVPKLHSFISRHML